MNRNIIYGDIKTNDWGDKAYVIETADRQIGVGYFHGIGTFFIDIKFEKGADGRCYESIYTRNIHGEKSLKFTYEQAKMFNMGDIPNYFNNPYFLHIHLRDHLEDNDSININHSNWNLELGKATNHFLDGIGMVVESEESLQRHFSRNTITEYLNKVLTTNEY